MLRELILELGLREVGRATGATPGTVWYWCHKGLPSRRADADRRAQYERDIAKLAGIKVGELRKQIAEEEAAKKEAAKAA